MKKGSAKVKTASAVGAQFVQQAAESRFAYLRDLTPELLVHYIESFETGDFRDLSRTMRAMEARDDIWMVSAAKTRKDVSRRKWECAPLEGFEDDPEAADQAEKLRAFYGRVSAREWDCRNVASGVRGLVSGLMRCYNDRFAVYEPVFRAGADGSLACELTRCPLEWFALRGGQMCFAPDGRGDGTALEPGGWVVCAGDGVGVACSVIKMVKTIALGDWLVYSGRCGHPGIHGKTSAQKGSTQWTEFTAALRKFGKEWAAATGLDDVIEKIDLSVAGTLPYPGLVDYANRAIASLQRGADLSTISAGQGSGEGASLQGDEADLICADNCETVSECLRSQLDPAVIAWHFGADAAVKAGFRLVPPQRDTIDRDLKIDAQLSGQGVRLSKRDALARYERREADPADPEDAPLSAPAQVFPSPVSGANGHSLANEDGGKGAAPADPVAKPLQIDAGACKEPAGVEVTPKADPPAEAILEAFSDEAEKALYASLLDAAIGAATKGDGQK